MDLFPVPFDEEALSGALLEDVGPRGGRVEAIGEVIDEGWSRVSGITKLLGIKESTVSFWGLHSVGSRDIKGKECSTKST